MTTNMDIVEHVDAHVQAHFPDVVRGKSWGETAFFYNPGCLLPNGVYFLTFKHRDSINDNASKLVLDGSVRLNLGLPEREYDRLFGPRPARPAKGATIDGPYDFAVRDQLMPHPVYAWMGWVCIVGPSPGTFEKLKPLLQLAHDHARARFLKRVKSLR